MSPASTPASRWAVSARTNGEVLTAGIARTDLELVVLGVPAGFSPVEIEGWLHDLAGVAVETCRADSRPRAIPAIMHHALTGLLFSHAELWDRLDSPRPCSSAFVDLPEGAAFGWVGEARVHVLVDGDPVEPQWVRVRDEAGREARAAVFAPGCDVVVTLEYWPQGEDGGAAPASIEAEWIGAIDAPAAPAPWPPAPAMADATAAPAAAITPAWFAGAQGLGGETAAPSEPDSPAEPAIAATPPDRPAPELPGTLPVDQPGLAASVAGLPRDPAGAEAVDAPDAPDVQEPAAVESEAPASASAAGEPAPGEITAGAVAGDPAPRPAHPVARWLSRVMNWGRREPREPMPVVIETDATPVSAYDALLSESVPPTAPEQTALDLLAPPDPGAFRPAGASEILGGAGAAAAASLASPPSGSIAVNQRLQALLREIEAAETSAMPVIAPEVPEGAAARPLGIDHEPVGADEAFAIPPLPSAPAETRAADDRVLAIPPLPISRVMTCPPPERTPSIAPLPQASGEPARAEVPEPAAQPPAAAVPEPVVETPAVAPEPAEPPRAVAPETVVPHAAVAPEPAEPPAAVAPGPMVPESVTPGSTGARVVVAPGPVASVAERAAAPEAPPMLRVPLPAREPAESAATAGPPATSAAAAAAEGGIEPPVTARRARSLESIEPPAPAVTPLHRRPVAWAAGVVAVFVVGWLVGGFSNPSADRGGPVMAALRAIGIGGAHFTASINSSPGGAHIEIDGKPQATRTPATLELAPGDHVVTLSLPGLGAVQVPVKGRKGEKLSIDEPLHGSLEILDADSSVPIAVSVDGRPAGYAPLRIESLAPGLHEVGFSGPGMPAWAQTVQVDVRGAAQMIARPMSAPANGILQAQATLNDERGASPLKGAQVYVDGELRGTTPLSIELPRGPHSLRVTYRGETAPVQVIDLPGGNQRFASFNFGLDLESPGVDLIGPTRTFASGQPKLVSAAITGMRAADVNEAWLHVRTAEGLWRRYAMTLLRGGAGPVVTAVFPDNVFDRQGNTRWYVSVVSSQGDECFSELETSSLSPPAAKAAAGRP